MQRTTLGGTGIEVSRLAFGTGTVAIGGQSEQARLGVEGLARLLLLGKDLGITFWDTAMGYGTHRHVARALQQVKREEVVITTKIPHRRQGQLEENVQLCLRELGTDYIDIVLLHCVMSADWPTELDNAMATLTRYKERGIVRALGVSTHSMDGLTAAAGHPWVDVVLARINYDGVHMDGKPAQVTPLLAGIQAHGQGLYGMKVYGQGELAGDPTQAMRYAWGLGVLDAVVIGMKSEAEVRQNAALVERLATTG